MKRGSRLDRVVSYLYVAGQRTAMNAKTAKITKNTNEDFGVVGGLAV